MNRNNALRRAGRALLPLFPLLVFMAACDEGDDPGPTGPDLTGEDVEGLYHPTIFTFDVQGSLPEKDVLAALESAGIQPELSIDTEGGFQFFFRNPSTGSIELIEGTYSLQDEGIELAFDDAADANVLLLPSEFELDFDAEAGTLSFQGVASVSSERLKALFPEFEDEPLAELVPGELTVRFTREA